mmetsp:Transcript_73688/g.117242  ORF Transcript_73688/g.117242 Transcript_73688/m.117242 type:complete len:114 (-) Transcript_73688:258-599(-)
MYTVQPALSKRCIVTPHQSCSGIRSSRMHIIANQLWLQGFLIQLWDQRQHEACGDGKQQNDGHHDQRSTDLRSTDRFVPREKTQQQDASCASVGKDSHVHDSKRKLALGSHLM